MQRQLEMALLAQSMRSIRVGCGERYQTPMAQTPNDFYPRLAIVMKQSKTNAACNNPRPAEYAKNTLKLCELGPLFHLHTAMCTKRKRTNTRLAVFSTRMLVSKQKIQAKHTKSSASSAKTVWLEYERRASRSSPCIGGANANIQLSLQQCARTSKACGNNTTASAWQLQATHPAITRYLLTKLGPTQAGIANEPTTPS